MKSAIDALIIISDTKNECGCSTNLKAIVTYLRVVFPADSDLHCSSDPNSCLVSFLSAKLSPLLSSESSRDCLIEFLSQHAEQVEEAPDLMWGVVALVVLGLKPELQDQYPEPLKEELHKLLREAAFSLSTCGIDIGYSQKRKKNRLSVGFSCEPQMTPVRRAYSKEDFEELMKENSYWFAENRQLQQTLAALQQKTEELVKDANKKDNIIKKMTDKLHNKADDTESTMIDYYSLKSATERENATIQKLRSELEHLRSEFGGRVMGLDVEADAKKPKDEVLIEYQEELATLRGECAAHLSTISDLEEHRNGLVLKLAETNSQKKLVEMYKKRVEEMERGEEKLLVEIQAEKVSTNRQKQTIKQLQGRIVELERRPEVGSNLADDTSLDHSQSLFLQQQLNRKQLEIEKLNEDLNKTKNELSTSNASASHKSEATVTLLLEKVSEVQQKLSTEELESTRLRDQRDRHAEQNAQLISEVKSERIEWMKELETAQDEVKRVRDEFKLSEEERIQGKQEIRTLNDSLEQQRTKIGSLETDLRKLKNDCISLESDLKVERKKALEAVNVGGQLQPEIELLHERLNAADSHVQKLKADLEIKEIWNLEKETICNNLKVNLEETRNALASSEAQQTENAKLVSSHSERLAKTMTELKQTKHDLQKLTQQNEKEVTRLETEVTGLRTTAEQLRQQLKASESRITTHRVEISELQAELYLNRMEVIKLTEATQAMGVGSVDVNSVQEGLEALQRQLKTAQNELESLHLSLEEKANQLAIDTQSGTDEFDAVYIADHFEREKRKLTLELREMCLRRGEAEAAKLKAVRELQTLRKTHGKTLRELCGLKQSSAGGESETTEVSVGTEPLFPSFVKESKKLTISKFVALAEIQTEAVLKSEITNASPPQIKLPTPMQTPTPSKTSFLAPASTVMRNVTASTPTQRRPSLRTPPSESTRQPRSNSRPLDTAGSSVKQAIAQFENRQMENRSRADPNTSSKNPSPSFPRPGQSKRDSLQGDQHSPVVSVPRSVPGSSRTAVPSPSFRRLSNASNSENLRPSETPIGSRNVAGRELHDRRNIAETPAASPSLKSQAPPSRPPKTTVLPPTNMTTRPEASPKKEATSETSNQKPTPDPTIDSANPARTRSGSKSRRAVVKTNFF